MIQTKIVFTLGSPTNNNDFTPADLISLGRSFSVQDDVGQPYEYCCSWSFYRSNFWFWFAM